MQLYWEAIRRGCQEGFRWFDFGRSTRGSGTYRFKRQWGATEQPLYWYRIPTAADRRQQASDLQRASWLSDSWRRLPLSVTRQLGPHVRKYLTQ
jgi:hypothetical protein